MCIYKNIFVCYNCIEEVLYMKERIKSIRKDARLTQEEFGSMLGLSRIVITTYETGRVIPDKPVRLLICERFNVNETWLETGEGIPYKEGLIPRLLHALQQMPNVQAALEEKLPYVSDETFQKMNEAFAAFLKDLK
jgi:transcriptional regulator with XRE-family HTH domain